MLEIILTLFLVGAVTGFIYSMPIAGPISIIIVSRAFQGKKRFCQRTALGSAIVEAVYVFIVVYGITALYELYQPFIPYFLLIGAGFIIFVGLKIRKHKIDLKSLESSTVTTAKSENRGGMRTGFVINMSNPTLFINWFIASFITLSFVSSIGLNIGGLDLILNENIKSVSEITGSELKQYENSGSVRDAARASEQSGQTMPLIMGLAFAAGVGTGTYIWLYTLTGIIIRYRDKIKISILDLLINILGIILILLGIYLAFQAVRTFLN